MFVAGGSDEYVQMLNVGDSDLMGHIHGEAAETYIDRRWFRVEAKWFRKRHQLHSEGRRVEVDASRSWPGCTLLPLRTKDLRDFIEVSVPVESQIFISLGKCAPSVTRNVANHISSNAPVFAAHPMRVVSGIDLLILQAIHVCSDLS